MSRYDIVVEFSFLEPIKFFNSIYEEVAAGYAEKEILFKVHSRRDRPIRNIDYAFMSVLYRRSPGYYNGQFCHNENGPGAIMGGKNIWYWLGEQQVGFDHWCRTAEISDKKKAALKLKYSD